MKYRKVKLLLEQKQEGHKEYKYLYHKMLDKDIIFRAYKKLRKGKTKRKEIEYIDAHYKEEAKKMYEMVLNTKPPDVPVPNPELAYKPRKRTPKIIFEHGKKRKIYMPEIREQWLHHIIVLVLEPIIMATAYPYTCGSLPKRGAHYGKRQIERWLMHDIKVTRCFAKLDIRHFYDNIKIRVLMKELSIRIKDEWFLYITELCLKGFKKGIPLGFYISQWLANYLLEPLDRYITEILGLKKYVRYMDDIVIFASNKKILHKAIEGIKQLLGQRFRLKLKRNYQVCKFYYESKNKIIGRPIDFMGFKFYRNKTTMRKSIMIAAIRLVKRMRKTKESGKRFYIKHVKSMLSYVGWFDHTDTYDLYENKVKPYINIKKLKKIASKVDRRRNNAGMEERTLLRAA